MAVACPFSKAVFAKTFSEIASCRKVVQEPTKIRDGFSPYVCTSNASFVLLTVSSFQAVSLVHAQPPKLFSLLATAQNVLRRSHTALYRHPWIWEAWARTDLPSSFAVGSGGTASSESLLSQAAARWGALAAEASVQRALTRPGVARAYEVIRADPLAFAQYMGDADMAPLIRQAHKGHLHALMHLLPFGGPPKQRRYYM